MAGANKVAAITAGGQNIAAIQTNQRHSEAIVMAGNIKP